MGVRVPPPSHPHVTLQGLLGRCGLSGQKIGRCRACKKCHLASGVWCPSYDDHRAPGVNALQSVADTEGGETHIMVWQVSFPSLMRLMTPHHHTCLLNEPLQLVCRLAMGCHLW